MQVLLSNQVNLFNIVRKKLITHIGTCDLFMANGIRVGVPPLPSSLPSAFHFFFQTRQTCIVAKATFGGVVFFLTRCN